MMIRDFRKITKRHIAASMIAVLIASSVPVISTGSYVHADEVTDAEGKISEAEEKKAEASEKRKDAEYKLNSLKLEKEDVMNLIEELDSEIAGYEEKIQTLGDKRTELRASAAVIENNLDSAYVLETKQYDDMKERIQFAYENGDADYIDALLSIKDYSAVINQSEYVDKVSVYDQKQLNKLLEIEKDINEYKHSVAESLAEVEELKLEAEGEQEALEVMQEGKRATIKEYNLKIADTEYSIEQLAAIEAEQDAQIAAIEAEAAAARAAAEAAAAAAAEAAQTASSTDASPAVPSYSGGAFVWPCPSSYVITSGYGGREAPTEGATTFHNGIDIGCDYGASIIAAADGIVSYVGYFGGGGNTVIIDHGDGLSTLYMHLSSFAVGQGENVSAGDTIAYAGSTGISTGPHLHFAVRVSGSYVDPGGYL